MSNRWDEAFKVAQANPQVAWRDQDAPRPAIAQPKNFVSPGPKPEPKKVKLPEIDIDDIKTRPSRPPKKVERQIETGQEQHNRHNNSWVKLDDLWFPSRLEARVYQELKYRQMAGDISHLKTQPVFVLQEKFRDNTGAMHREITYIADFIYRDLTGNIIVVDAKGMETTEFSIKKKLFLKRYPQYRFELVREAHKTKRKGRKG